MTVRTRSSSGASLGPLYAAARARLGLVAMLFAVAVVGWLWTAQQSRGMDGGPWTALGSLVWFLGVWVVMMAAMMLPSVAPTVALFARMTGPRSRLPWMFVSGYLLMWAAAGLLAFAVGAAATELFSATLAWDAQVGPCPVRR